MTSRAAAAGLSTAEIEEIRGSLAAGRKPKVMFTSQAGQIAGEIGQVVRLTDPQESDEWLVVKFGRDELPFSPADLSIPPRGRAARKPATAPEPAPAGAAGGATAPATGPAKPPPAPGRSVAAAPASTTTSASTGAAADGRPAKRAAKRTASGGRAGRPKLPATMTVTLAYEAGEWTVGATQGSKVLAKPYVIGPAEALKMVSMLDVAGVHEAVEQIVTAELEQAQQRAEQLRSELAEVEARLAELRGEG